MRLLSIFLIIFTLFSTPKVYQRVQLQDIKLELSYNSTNKCRNHVAVQNLSDKKITYFIRIWRGDIWYFKHQIELEPHQSKSWVDAFITCDNHSQISIELVKI